MSTYTETRTQEDIAELHAQNGLGCKACGKPVNGKACASEGDIYCWDCGLAIDLMPGTTVNVLPTREQVAVLAAWEAQGIGAN